MRIIPVLDLLNGVVVHGIGGKREQYKPIEHSVLTKSIEPLEVIKDFQKGLALSHYYLADLNRIQNIENRKINDEQIIEIASIPNVHLLVDGGCKNSGDVVEILTLGVQKVIVGTETLESIEALKEIVDKVGSENIILSVDLYEGKLLSNSYDLQKSSLTDIITKIDALSLNSIILLDLYKIGKQEGPLSNSLLEVINLHPLTPIYVGGGVRDKNDLLLLKSYGLAGCLVATAFHKGCITKEDLGTI